ncbi:aa3-type cytochrome c oxidase subunit IV [Aliiroseovarius sp. S1339]|nr:aa3-type cytochrome c oxidase subunit IV [Aliiroseovarius sp. S1339]MCK8463937.1 aa3-type cytochrome c oxidase subunit IV [Aliiroseovarius sp. S1339]
MADHVVGTMDTSTQEKTFEGFVKIAARTVVVCVVILVLLAIFNA